MSRIATQIIAVEEGFSPRVYMDTEGYPTVGYGLKVGGKDLPFDAFAQFPLMPESVAFAWLDSLVADLDWELKDYDWFRSMSETRQAVVISMAYQLGMSGLLKFRNTIEYFKDQDYQAAAIEMLDSRWYQQTPNRARRHADIIGMDALDEYYLSGRWTIN